MDVDKKMSATVEITESNVKIEKNFKNNLQQDEKEVLLKVDNVTKIYGKNLPFKNKFSKKDVFGIQNVSFTVKKGEIFGFLGPNGAGKTTTIRSILNYLKIQAGSITIAGLSHIDDALEIRKIISYVPGDVSLFENFTGNELITYLNSFRKQDSKFLAELEERFRVDLTKKIKSLSKGNRQQVALIAALASRPQLLILDEPTSGLDPLMSSTFHKILRELKEQGTTIFLSSHDLTEVQAICDRVGIIKDGKMILVEDVSKLKEKFLQNITIKFNKLNKPSLEDIVTVPSVLDVTEISENRFSLKINKKINEFLKFIANYDVEKMNIEESSLEDIFLHFYQ